MAVSESDREFAERVSIQSAQMLLLAEGADTEQMRSEMTDMAVDMARRARAFASIEDIMV